MICKHCERNLKTIAHLNGLNDRLSYQVEGLEKLLKKSQENEKFCLDDRDKIKLELLELKERMT